MTMNLPILADNAQSGSSMFAMLAVYAVIIIGGYFLFIRPQSKRKKEEAQMRNSLEIGDEITTIGGIMGRVVAIKEDEDAIIIETGSDRVKMKFKKWCISTVDTVKEKAADTASTEKKGLFGKKKNDESKTQAEKDIEK